MHDDRGRTAGFTVIEILVAMTLTLIVSGVALTVINSSAAVAYAQPEAMDMQQRARLVAALVTRDLLAAGAGVDAGPLTGSLAHHFAPILPRRIGRTGPDAFSTARADVIAVLSVPDSYLETTLAQDLPSSSSPLVVSDSPNCPRGRPLCGLTEGMTILLADDTGQFDLFTLTSVQATAGHLQALQATPGSYRAGAMVLPVDVHVYAYDAANHQIRQYDGASSDVPVIDNAVGLSFEYFGRADPPTEPRPGIGTANCLYDAAGQALGGMATLHADGGSLAPLPLSLFRDGPWCGVGANRFDADLLRVKMVRVTARVQAAQASMRRARTSDDQILPGTGLVAANILADYTVAFDVAPRNLNLGR